MRKAKSIGELLGEANVQGSKDIEFEYHYSKGGGKKKYPINPSNYNTVIHLGYCEYDKTDYFLATHKDGYVHIYSGKLNDGTY